MATLAEIKAYATKKGIQLRTEAPVVNPRIAELKAFLNPQKEVRTLNEQSEKTTSAFAKFVGGEALARGAGVAIKSKMVEKNSSELLRIKIKKMKAIESELFAAKRDGRTKDIERISQALREEIQTSSGAADQLEAIAKEVPSTKEIIGSTLRLGATLASGAIGRGAAQLTGANTAKTVLGGIGRGAGAGAIAGAGEGAIQGAGLGMEANKDTKGILTSAALGAGIGGVAGGLIGGVAGGIQGKVNKNKLARQQYIEDLVAPKDTTKVREQALAEGRTTEAGLLNKSKIIPSNREKKLAEAVEGVVKQENSIVENIDALRSKGKEINKGVKDYITKNKTPFNTQTLRSQFDSSKVENKLIFASDANAEKTYDAVVDEFMKHVGKKDTLGVFNARQEFDKIPAIKKLLDSEGLGENVRKVIVLDVRRTANEYIASLLPKGNKYRELLIQESRMIEVLGNIAEKEAKNIGMNKLQILSREYPWLKWVIGGVGVGITGAAGVGVGSAIIGSSD